MRAFVLLALAASGCFRPNIADGQYSCSPGVTTGDNCPDGYSCSACGLCYKGSSPVDDHANCATGCSNNGGQRAGGDVGLDGIAFCPAAWSVPGLTDPAARATPCNRQPGADGKGCSVEDNCSAGWHVCSDEADLGAHGFTAQNCLAAPGGMWLTRQPGTVDPADPRRAGQCGSSGSNNLYGCGSLGSKPSCGLLQRGMNYTDCLNSMVWSCGTDPSQGLEEQRLVVKPSLDLGGVICCRD